ncbi:histidine--tRNA ligase [Candidatus Saccharibacteria bacterium]|nr:histidine--tRNA ligase [Candidatus Saccharibacteria bacterium]
MKKINTSPISGMQELLPNKQAIFNNLLIQIANVYHAHGFLSIETPLIDRTEILLAKAGGDTEKQIYRVIKTNETADDADQALRFDHTVPLARYVVEHENDLKFPFKVTQIGRNFRGERAQKGRFREFYQCDIDVIGRGKLPLSYDADVVMTAYEALKTFVKPEILVRISNRKILGGLLVGLGLADKSDEVFGIIDHAEKVPIEKTLEAYAEEGLDDSQIETLKEFTEIHGSLDEVLPKLEIIRDKVGGELLAEGISELKAILGLIEAQGLNGKVIADMMIVRGLDYYTGSVFETVIPEHKEIGSICSGGRYDNLASYYTEQQLPGVGISIGLTRLFYILNEYGLIDEEKFGGLLDYCVCPITDAEIPFATEVAQKLRAEGNRVDVIYAGKNIGDKLKYAASVAKAGIVIGENEAATGKYVVKEFK